MMMMMKMMMMKMTMKKKKIMMITPVLPGGHFQPPISAPPCTPVHLTERDDDDRENIFLFVSFLFVCLPAVQNPSILQQPKL